MIGNALLRALALTAEMAWDTWWALVVGLTVSGAVEVFVSDAWMRSALGGDGWREVGLGAGLGVASSSCSYSAVGTTKTLFKKGASAPAALGAFMFASTDLVVELGLAMWVLLGWQFVVGEYLGGVLAVIVVALLLKHAVPDAWIEAARAHVRATDGLACATCDATMHPEDPAVVERRVDGRTERFCCEGCATAFEATRDDRTSALASRAGWTSAATATMKDWEMIGRDVVVGFFVAGLVGAAVPAAWWSALFGAQHGFGGILWNTVLAVLVGVLTVTCSVGNVPFALVLWRNGLPFGAVLAFVYADLLIPPLVDLYRRYYGARMAAALVASLFVAAVVAGVAVHYLATWTGLVPAREAVGGTLAGEYTTVLNFVATPLFVGQAVAAYGRSGVERRLRTAARRVRDWLAAGETWLCAVAFALLVALAALADACGPAARRLRSLAEGLGGSDARQGQGGDERDWRPPYARRAAARAFAVVRRVARVVRALGLVAWRGLRAVADGVETARRRAGDGEGGGR